VIGSVYLAVLLGGIVAVVADGAVATEWSHP